MKISIEHSHTPPVNIKGRHMHDNTLYYRVISQGVADLSLVFIKYDDHMCIIGGHRMTVVPAVAYCEGLFQLVPEGDSVTLAP